MTPKVMQKIYSFFFSTFLLISPSTQLPALLPHLDGNAGIVADHLNNIVINPLGDLAAVLVLLNPNHLEEELVQFQPSGFSDLDWSTENSLANTRQIISNNLLARVREYKCSSVCDRYGCAPYRNFWISAMGGHLQQKKLHELPAFHSNDWGIISGFDFVLAEWLTAGVAGGYSHTDLKWDDLKGKNSIHNYYIGPYLAWNRGCWEIDASLLRGSHCYHSDRHIHLPGFHHKAKNNHYASSFLVHLGSTLNYCWGVFDFQPFLSTDYIYLHVNSLKEKGALDLDLHVKTRNVQFFQGEVGALLSATFCSNSVIIVPTVKAGFQNITPFTDTKVESSLRGDIIGIPFKVHTTTKPIYQWTTGLFLNFYIQNCPEISFSYNGAFSGKRREYSYSGEIDWSF